MGRHQRAHCTLRSPSKKKKHARHGGFQTLDVDHRTDSRRPLDQPPTTTGTDEDGDGRYRRQTKTETGDVGDRRRRRQAKRRKSKTKTDSLWGRAKWQLPNSWRHTRVTKMELDTCPLKRPDDSRANEGCSSLCSPRSSRGATPVFSFLNLLSGKQMVTKRWQSPQVVPTGLTEDLQPNLRNYGPKWTTPCLLRFWQSSLLKTYNFLCPVKDQHIWLADHMKQTVNRVSVGKSFHNVPSHRNTFSSVQNG